MSQLYRHERIQDIGTQLFAAAGAEESQAAIATAALVQSSLMGHDSHGVMRIPEYLGFIDDGSLKPAAETIATETGPSTARVDCGYGFGAVGGAVAIEKGIEIAREHQTACVITRECNHVGRLGAYTQMAADAGFIALATCNSPIYGHFVLPFGGKEGRLATNPIAYGIPTAGDPAADFKRRKRGQHRPQTGLFRRCDDRAIRSAGLGSPELFETIPIQPPRDRCCVL